MSRVNVAMALKDAQSQLATAGSASRLEAELLLAFVLDLSRAELYTHPERTLSTQQMERYQALVERRIQGVPLAYLTGYREFYGLQLKVNPHVLIPRPETELLVDLARSIAPALAGNPVRSSARRADAGKKTPDYTGLSIADVGTGSGCIAVALATQLPGARVYALDLSPDALPVARANAVRHGVQDRITVRQSDVLEALPEPVDLIVSNPPYIAAGEWSHLPGEIREHEPRIALQGGLHGLDIIYKLLHQAPSHLRPRAAILVEIGATQGAAVIDIAEQLFSQATVEIHPDLAGHDRALCVRTHSSRTAHAR